MSDGQVYSTQDELLTKHIETGRANIPLESFAGELIRLPEVVKRNLETGVAPIQTLSQLNAMEPIIAVLRVAGLNSIKDRLDR
jgi:hypothetical protein